jgi:transcriptional regulator with XRE-family HTH domain
MRNGTPHSAPTHSRQAHSANVRVPLREQLTTEFVSAREALGCSSRELALRCGISRTHLNEFERGVASLSPELLDRLAIELDVEIVLRLRRPVPIDEASRVSGDVVHARCVSVTRRQLERAGYECRTEEAISLRGSYGWIDLLGFDARTRRLIVVEVKTELRDLGRLDRQVESYARTCLEAAARHGWHPAEILVVVVVLATTEVDAFISVNRTHLASSYPVRGMAAVGTILDGAPITGRALILIDPTRIGRRIFTSSRVDGRKTEAPFRDYADCAQRLAERASSRMRCR